MRRGGLINKISSKDEVTSIKSMQVLDEQSNVYFNFINSLNSESTRKSYKFCIEKFLSNYDMDLALFLKLPQDEMTNLIIKYFVDKKISKQYKNQIFSTLKHSCEMNDVVLNCKKRERNDGYRKGVHKYRSKRIDYEKQEDPDIRAEIDRGAIVNILYDTSR